MTEDNDLNNIFICACGQPNVISNYFAKYKVIIDCSTKNVKPNTVNDKNYRSNNMGLHSKIKEEFLHYCYNSTIRGVPRIAKSRNQAMKILWILSFIYLLLGFFACLYLLGRQYFEYNVIHPPRVLTDTDSDFPAVTICNSRPLSSEGKAIIKKNNWRQPNEFSFLINEWAKKHFFEFRKPDYYLATYAMQLSTYLESLPSEEDRMSLGHRRQNFVIYCQIAYLNGSKGIAEPCHSVGKWSDYIHAFYINCATFNLGVKYRQKTKTMEMYLYLEEDINEINCPDCNRYDIKSQLSGAVLGIDRPETFSNINEKSIILMPGTLTEIRLKTFQNIQKSPPYGRCSIDTPAKLKMFNKEMVYSEIGCKQTTIQMDIERRCKCVAIEYPYNRSNLPFCSSLSSFLYKTECNIKSNPLNNTCIEILERIVQNMKCKEQITRKYYRDYIENCTMPCSFLSYESDRSTSMWPTKSYQYTLLSKGVFKENKLILKPEFEPYRKIEKLVKVGKLKEASKILDQTNILERNLLAVLISKPNFNLHKVEEKEVLSLTSFLSQIGGLGSIWIGLTMISVVEMLELLIQIGNIYYSKRNSEKVNEYETNENKPWSFYTSNNNSSKSMNLMLPEELKDNKVQNEKEIQNNSLDNRITDFHSKLLKCQKCNKETVLNDDDDEDNIINRKS